VRGEGFPVVLHSGGLGDLSCWDMAGYISGLRGYKCILIDPRGHGSSDSPEAVEAHKISDYVSDVVAVLDRLGVCRTAFFGYSNGGRVGFALSASHPGRLTALIAMGSCVDLDRESVDELSKFLRSEGIVAYLESAEAEEKTRFPRWVRENFSAGNPEMFALELEGLLSWEGVGAVAKKINVPTLLLTGGLEDPDSDCQKLASKLPAGAQLVILRNLGHIGVFLRSDVVLLHVRDFLARVQFGLDRRFS
jgi:pimeloyl-ACP methyl ester carboxylesterase